MNFIRLKRRLKSNKQGFRMEITIQADGSLLVPRGTPDDNQFYSQLLSDMLSPEEAQDLANFFASSDDIETLFGHESLCG